MELGIPFFGNLLLCLSLIATGYVMFLAIQSGRSLKLSNALSTNTSKHDATAHLRFLRAARLGTFATCAFVAVAVIVLAFAFQTHDFRIRYVARYSDRSMPWWYLLTSLWGGQDGSLLWWSFLLCGYTTFAVLGMRDKYIELQPYVIATLMSILAFFLVLMLFASNPFEKVVGTVAPEGEGLNPLLQNYWMVIHPPTLYLGFVGWSVPFAFVVAALITGRLDEEWIEASRSWMLLSWLFLSVGLALGMLWSYEELGWGGYWAWDPVENASFHPWLVGTAFLHSIIVQERYRMLKVWNVSLICLTFFLTIFGTFLTRSGLIASVHSFARSDIGNYFAVYLVVLFVACTALIIWRVPALRARHQIHSLISREFAILLNNWILLAMTLFVIVATTFPLLSEWLRDEEVTVGAEFYNKWMVPFGLILLFLMGVGPLISWRKATGKKLLRAFLAPTVAALVVTGLHVVLGAALGMPATIRPESIYETGTGTALAAIHSIAPAASSFFVTFVIASVFQEFWRGTRVRMKGGEAFHTALIRLTARAKRRYGGYLVHVGIALMYLGFTGAAYDKEEETTLTPGEVLAVHGYELRYLKPRMESDRNKRMVFADLAVRKENGPSLGTVSPAKFIYRTHPQMPTTEVAIQKRLREDLYVIMAAVDPESKRLTLRVIVRPLVGFIWLGVLVLIFGTAIALAPTTRSILASKPADSPRIKGGGKGSPDPAISVATTVLFACLAIGASVALHPIRASAQSSDSSSLHAGTVVMNGPKEKKLFSRTLCQCGECARLPLSTCGCGWAETKRSELRNRMESGESVQEILTSYRAQYGAKAIAIPSDQGLDRALWAVPIAGACLAIFGVLWVGFRWKNAKMRIASGATTGNTGSSEQLQDSAAQAENDRLDRKLDEELGKL